MAKSKIGGVYGRLKGAVGSAVFSTKKDRKMKRRVQIVRQKASMVANPNTTGQIMQRMKLKPIQRFYDAFENAVSGGILSHSYEGIPYGYPSYLYYKSLAMKEDDMLYIPKNATRFIPLPVTVSKGSLPSVDAELGINDATEYDGQIVLTAGRPEQGVVSAQLVTRLVNMGVPMGAQLTFMAVVIDYDNALFLPCCFRVVNKLGSVLESYSSEYAGYKFGFCAPSNDRGALITMTPPDGGKEPVALAVIVSMQDASGKWLRSTERLQLISSIYETLRSPEALEAAIQSYLSANAMNELNSQWYLNLALKQAFPGKLVYLNMPCGDNFAFANVVVGVEQRNNTLYYTVFTPDGESSSGVVFNANGNAMQNVTGADIVSHNANTSVAVWNSDYATQVQSTSSPFPSRRPAPSVLPELDFAHLESLPENETVYVLAKADYSRLEGLTNIPSGSYIVLNIRPTGGGYYTVDANLVEADGNNVIVQLYDEYGNETTQQALIVQDLYRLMGGLEGRIRSFGFNTENDKATVWPTHAPTLACDVYGGIFKMTASHQGSNINVMMDELGKVITDGTHVYVVSTNSEVTVRDQITAASLHFDASEITIPSDETSAVLGFTFTMGGGVGSVSPLLTQVYPYIGE